MMTLEIGRAGLQDAAGRFRAAASDVAAATTPPRTSDSADSAQLSEAVRAQESPDLAGAMVDMKEAKHAYTANLRVIETASSMTGSLLDAVA